jgi:ubiquitin C-terminal hydrolase
VQATKRISLDVPPQLLILHLKRFLFRSHSTKINTFVEYSTELDLGPYLTLSPEQLEAAYTAGGNPLIGKDNQPVHGSLELVYTLCSFLVHWGSSSNSGHYFSFVRALDVDVMRDKNRWGAQTSFAPFNPQSHKWFELNDSKRNPVKFSAISEKQAYILFYVPVQPLVVAALANSAKFIPPMPLSSPNLVKKPQETSSETISFQAHEWV